MTNKYLKCRFTGRINTKQLFHSSKCNAKSISLLLTSNFHWLQLSTDRYLNKSLLLVVTWALEPNVAEPWSKSLGRTHIASERTSAYQRTLSFQGTWLGSLRTSNGPRSRYLFMGFPLISNLPGISPNAKQSFSYCIISAKLSLFTVTSLCYGGGGVECLNISPEFSHFLTYSHAILVLRSMERAMLLMKIRFSLPPFLSLERNTWIIELHYFGDWLGEGEMG